MRLTEVLQPADLLVGFAASDKWEAIRQLVDHLGERGAVPAELLGDVREAVLARERSMSTGMEQGIAIPHAAIEGLETIAGCLGIVGREEGLEFQSIDGRPTRLIVLLAIPKAQKLLHIRTLADVARLLGREPVRQALLAASTPEEAWAALREGELEGR
jgi:mannitol/fructose-specific phosphotransferase system IIA component (Ntr-type)